MVFVLNLVDILVVCRCSTSRLQNVYYTISVLRVLVVHAFSVLHYIMARSINYRFNLRHHNNKSSTLSYMHVFVERVTKRRVCLVCANTLMTHHNCPLPFQRKSLRNTLHDVPSPQILSPASCDVIGPITRHFREFGQLRCDSEVVTLRPAICVRLANTIISRNTSCVGI